MTTADAPGGLRVIARGLADTGPVSGYLFRRLVDEIERGGPLYDLVAIHPQSNEPLFAARILAGVNLGRLSGRLPAFADHLAMLAWTGEGPGNQTWNLFRQAVLTNADLIVDAIARPVQQHEPDRAGHLLRGLGLLGAPKVRLLELGACAGLALLVDRYRWHGNGWAWGPQDSPAHLPAPGGPPGDFHIVERAGCDIAPRDPRRAADVLVLRSFLPIELHDRHAQFEAGIRLATEADIQIDRADAVEWLDEKLGGPVEEKVTTVVWHSYFWPFLTATQQADIDGIITAAAARGRLARISYEPRERETTPHLQLATYG